MNPNSRDEGEAAANSATTLNTQLRITNAFDSC